jgi:uncharacterized OB-fold protein
MLQEHLNLNKDVTIGMKVEAVFKPKAERKGAIGDIKYFKPLA